MAAPPEYARSVATPPLFMAFECLYVEAKTYATGRSTCTAMSSKTYKKVKICYSPSGGLRMTGSRPWRQV
jgi:hypothetical protein